MFGMFFVRLGGGGRARGRWNLFADLSRVVFEGSRGLAQRVERLYFHSEQFNMLLLIETKDRVMIKSTDR